MKTPQELNELADTLTVIAKHPRAALPGIICDKCTAAAHELRHMSQLRADLHEAAVLLREHSQSQYAGCTPTWVKRRDSFLAKLKGGQ